MNWGLIGGGEGSQIGATHRIADIAEHLRARREGRDPCPLALSYPTATDGLHGIASVQAAVESAKAYGAWIPVRC